MMKFLYWFKSPGFAHPLFKCPSRSDIKESPSSMLLQRQAHPYKELRSGGSRNDSGELVEVVNLSPLYDAAQGSALPHHNANDEPAENGTAVSNNDKHGTVLSGYLNITNTILGSSVLGLPFAYAHTGWLLGTFLLILCAASSAFALHTLSLCAMKLNSVSNSKDDASFYSVGRATLPSLTLLIDVAIALKCFGVAISYLIVIGDLMPYVMRQFGASGIWVARELWVFLGWVMAVPFSLQRDLSSLSTVSSLAIGFVSFFALLVFLYTLGISGLDPCGGSNADSATSCKGEIQAVVLDGHTLKAIPIFVFCFTCQQNIFAVCNEMQDITVRRVSTVISGAVGTGLGMYLVLASIGYATFGSHVDVDFLTNYPDNALTSVARIFISLLVTFSYPLQCHPARRCVTTIVQQLLRRAHAQTGSSTADTDSSGDSTHASSAWAAARGGSEDAQGYAGIASSPGKTAALVGQAEFGDGMAANGVAEDGGQSRVGAGNDCPSTGAALESSDGALFMTITVAFLALTLLIAICVSDLSVVLGLVGATGSTTVSYILPGFYYYYLFQDPAEGPGWKRTLALVQGTAGLIIVPVCLTFIFL